MSPAVTIYPPGMVIHANFPFGRHYAVVRKDTGESLEVHVVTSKRWPREIHPTIPIDSNEGLPFSRISFIQVRTESNSKDLIDNEFDLLSDEYLKKLQEVRE